MEETDEKSEGGAARESGSTGAEEAELRAEEESAKAMEAEVPNPPGYPDPGQEQPS
ncbi:MAG: hypothetical protein QOH49_2657 [Acidobacteriota bacterium]|jgi:hypothetical protein|nr:hypothetical protein [Acidobacteriota bacterium]